MDEIRLKSVYKNMHMDFSGPFQFNFNCIVVQRQFALVFAHCRFLALIEGAYESDKVALSRFLEFIGVFSINHNPWYVIVRRIQTFCTSTHIMFKLVAFRPLSASFDGAVTYFGQCTDTASCAFYRIIRSLHARYYRQIQRRVPSKVLHHSDFKDVSETFFIAVLTIELPGAVLVLFLMSVSIRIELNLHYSSVFEFFPCWVQHRCDEVPTSRAKRFVVELYFNWSFINSNYERVQAVNAEDIAGRVEGIGKKNEENIPANHDVLMPSTETESGISFVYLCAQLTF